MTARRDPDAILEAWLDLMPSEVPDRAIEAVLRVVETAPQVRRRGLGGIRRSPTMTRLILIVAAALVGAALLGGALLGGGGRPALDSRTSSPAPSPQATEAPIVAGLEPGMGYAATAPDLLTSASWVAALPAIPGITDTPQVARLLFAAGGRTPNLELTDGGIVNLGRVVTAPGSMLGFGSPMEWAPCAKDDHGSYQLAIAADGVHLDLATDDETCPARATALGRTWARSLISDTTGGRGVLPVGGSVLSLTVPDGTWTGWTGPASATVVDEARDRTLFVVHDPVSRQDPCVRSGGPGEAPSSADAFAAYLRTLPGFTVQTESIRLGDRPAMRIVIPTRQTTDCPSGKVWEWLEAGQTDGGWFISQGDTDVLYLVEHDDGLWLLQWLGAGVTRDEELSVLGSIAFPSSLDQPIPAP
jgi:hypothetical protein